jgi:protein-S-isoprenylcysteine O-methyltransferase Ste14
MAEPLIFRALTALLLITFVAHRAFYTRKYPAPESDTVDILRPGIAERLASALSVVALASTAVYVLFPAWLGWASLPLPTWLRWLGVAIALGGFGLLELSHRALGREWSDRPRLTRAPLLVQSGPYRWIRHPIYAAFLLILCSTLLITANWLVGLTWITSVAIDAAARIRFEEARLSAHFGQAYESYAARTGRLVPRVRRDRLDSTRA